jgi:hypothetical protein
MSGTIDHVNITPSSTSADQRGGSGVGGFADPLPICIDWSATLANGTGAAQASAGLSGHRIARRQRLDEHRSRRVADQRLRRDDHVHEDQAAGDSRPASANNVANNLQVSRGSSNGFVWFLAASDGFYLAPGAWNSGSTRSASR